MNFQISPSFVPALLAAVAIAAPAIAHADSVNSPNITMNVDTNRVVGPGAGNVSVTIGTVTVAETILTEYSSGTGKRIILTAKSGYSFDPSSAISATSATIGINGLAANTAAAVSPSGSANESITFNFTSGTSATIQDIVRISGIKLRIASAAGAAGPSQTTTTITTSNAGGAFTNQGIIAATINRGVASRLLFSIQPGNTEAGSAIVPSAKIVDFGGNLLTSESRLIALAISTNPGSGTLLGTTSVTAVGGVATWSGTQNLNITSAASGYVLQASHNGGAFLESDTVTSNPFDITAGDPGGLIISSQPADTTAGGDILVAVTAVDEFSNPITATSLNITLDSATNPGGWPLLVDTSLTKATVNGVATWDASDHLRITKAVAGYTLSASGNGLSVTTDPFDITASAPSMLRFVDQPVDTIEETTMPVSVEVIDAFGNRTDSSATISLATLNPDCASDLSNGVVLAAAGLATFPGLSVDSPCAFQALGANSTGLIGASSDVFSVTAKDAIPIEIKSAQIKKGKLVKFSAKGPGSISKAAIDDPTKKGALLTVTGTTGSVRYRLPKSGWSRSKGGFKFSGSKCQSVTVQSGAVSASCEGKTGSLRLPEDGPVSFVLALGKGTAKLCGECGGSSAGNPVTTFKRTGCGKPDSCP